MSKSLTDELPGEGGSLMLKVFYANLVQLILTLMPDVEVIMNRAKVHDRLSMLKYRVKVLNYADGADD